MRKLLLILVVGCAAARLQYAHSTPAGEAPPPPHPNERTQMIQQLDERIATDRKTMGLPAQPSADDADKMHSLEPLPAPEPLAETNTCHEVCDLADDICRNQENICRLSDELADDDWAKGRCDSAKASCKEAKDHCEKCTPE
jgi:hypothetical protein